MGGMCMRKGKSIRIDPEFYNKILRRPALLASRLLGSPQALHFFYVVYFGKNTELPSAPQSRERYGSDKSVNDLSTRDKNTVREQLLQLSEVVRFEFDDTIKHAGQCEPLTKPLGEHRCKSLIRLKPGLCTAAHTKDITCEDLAFSDFYMAAAMLHEVAHAAGFDVMGKRREDFFEDAIVAEAGFEFVSRIFGLIPAFYPKDDQPSLAIWYTW